MVLPDYSETLLLVTALPQCRNELVLWLKSGQTSAPAITAPLPVLCTILALRCVERELMGVGERLQHSFVLLLGPTKYACQWWLSCICAVEVYEVIVGQDKRESQHPFPRIRDSELNFETTLAKTGRVATLYELCEVNIVVCGTYRKKNELDNLKIVEAFAF